MKPKSPLAHSPTRPLAHSQLDQRLMQLRVSGFCILNDVIPQDRCALICERVVEAVRRARGDYPTAPKNVGFTPSIINHEQSFAEYLADARLLTLIRQVLGQHIRISFTSAIINEPDNERGVWHADWPFSQTNAGHIPAPYPDAVIHITTLWMLSPFETSNGGTLVLPGSHRCSTNPTAGGALDPHQDLPGQIQATGSPGSVLVMDSRLWHATAPNQTDQSRVALAVRYAPWWLNLEVLRPESDVRKQLCDESGMTDNLVPLIRREVYERLPAGVRALYRHWTESASGRVSE